MQVRLDRSVALALIYLAFEVAHNAANYLARVVAYIAGARVNNLARAVGL
jgi:hypothetical protein